MLGLVVHGASGRMGTLLCALAREDERFELVASLDRPRDGAAPDAEIAAVVDFSSDEGARRAAAIAVRGQAALLVGTTGLTRQTLDVLADSARSVPVMIAPNTSRGVAVLNHLVREACRLMPGAEIDLIEQHHRHKRDAPSGTARRLLDTIETVCGGELPAERVHWIRAGEIVGEHEVQLTLGAERLRLAHLASGREIFARGALDAVAWLATRPAGSYRIEQALGLA